MKLEISKLSEAREIVFIEEWDAAAWDLATPFLVYDGPLRIEARAKKDSGLAVINIAFSANVHWICDRCFQEFKVPIDKKVQIAYSLDLSCKIITLDDDIRQELLLGYPVKVLCKEDCKGLCPHCGADLNKGACFCKRN